MSSILATVRFRAFRELTNFVAGKDIMYIHRELEHKQGGDGRGREAIRLRKYSLK